MTTEKTTYTDVCWTLFYSNTTFDFLDFLMPDVEYRKVQKMLRSRGWRLVNLIVYKLTGIDFLRKKAIRHLQGFTRKELMRKAEDFYNNYLLPRKIDEVWTLQEGKKLTILSGTLDIIAETVAKHLNAKKYYASTLTVDENGVCTGEYKDLLLKKNSIEELSPAFDIYTDNLTDLPLVMKSENAVIVEYGNRNRWKKHLKDKTNIQFIHAAKPRY